MPTLMPPTETPENRQRTRNEVAAANTSVGARSRRTPPQRIRMMRLPSFRPKSRMPGECALKPPVCERGRAFRRRARTNAIYCGRPQRL